MRTLIAIAALALLASCAETPSKPTTSGGSSSGSGKVVTATPEETFDCDEDLILEPHLPEECIPPEPAEPVKPAEPPEPDPIVGTYRVFSLTKNYQRVLRFYPDGSATINGAVRSDKFALRWEKENEIYRVYQGPSKKVRPFAFKLQSIAGEPDLAPALTGGYEGLRVSNNPNYLFDLYVVECLAKSGSERCGADTAMGMVPRPGWTCWNIGRRLGDRGYYWVTWVGVGNEGKSRDYADSRAECEALCESAILNKFETVGEGNCSDYQG